MNEKTFITGFCRVLAELEKLGEDTAYNGLRDEAKSLRLWLDPQPPAGKTHLRLLVLTGEQRDLLLACMRLAGEHHWIKCHPQYDRLTAAIDNAVR